MINAKPSIPVCILAGRQSRRFGKPKGLASLNGQRLIDIVLRRLNAQTSGPLLLNCDPAGPYSKLGLPMKPDGLPGDLGPLAGVHTAMEWGREHGFDLVATCLIDVPFLPENTIEELSRLAAPSVCASDAQCHPLIGLWPYALAGDLADFLKAGPRSAHSWVEKANAGIVEFPKRPDGNDPFFNINNQSDLKQAMQVSSLSGSP